MTDWRSDAACATTSPEAFFPDNGASAQPARTICGTCLVRAECLDDALTFDAVDDFGIRGGLTAADRRELRRTRKEKVA